MRKRERERGIWDMREMKIQPKKTGQQRVKKVMKKKQNKKIVDRRVVTGSS